MIGDEKFIINKFPAQIHLELLSWRANLVLPNPPVNAEYREPGVIYRTDFRSEFDLLFDLMVMTLNASRNQDQKDRFEITREWITDPVDGVSGDMLDELVYDVLDPFLTRLKEKELEAEKKQAIHWTSLMEPMLIEIVQREIAKMNPIPMKPLINSAISSENSAPLTDGQKNIV